MIKNAIKIFAIVTTLTVISCKDERESFKISLDDKNLVVGQSEAQFSNVVKEYIRPADYAKMKFEETNFDFGSIIQGDKVEHVFKFTNIGHNDLLIQDARASCGCTIPEWTKTPIKAGDKGELKVIFNSAGKSGDQNKTVTLTTNTQIVNEVVNFKVHINPNPNIKSLAKTK